MARRVDFCAREPHFADHLIPTYRALPDNVRGHFFTGSDPGAAARARKAGISPDAKPPTGASRLTVVASYRDLKIARSMGRPVVYCEHGAGQGYLGVKSGSYIGAEDRDGAVAVLVPGEHAKARQLAAHPDLPVYVVGCPKLDAAHRRPPLPATDKPTIAVSFHWDCLLAPETRSAFRPYRKALPGLARHFKVIGHAHPRMWARVEPVYRSMKIERVRDFDEVLRRAHLYVVDNSSTLFEFASLDRPVVLLNAPYYRKNVEHGMRFWEFADIGPQVHRRMDLIPGVIEALEDPPEFAQRRQEVARAIYGEPDGKAAERAAAALMEIVRSY